MYDLLTNYILEEDFLNSFSSFRFLQMILGSCRVNAHKWFVTAPSAGQRLYTVALATLSCFFAVSTMMIYADRFNDHPNLYHTCFVILALHLITYISNLIHVRFHNNQSNVQFYVEMQKVDRVMKIEKIKGLNKMYQRISNGVVSFLVALQAALSLVALGGGPFILLGYCSLTVAHSSFVLEVVFCSNLLIFFTLRTQYLNAIMANHIIRKINYANIDKTTTFMRQAALKTHDFVSCDADVYLRKIFTCFSFFQKIYTFQILLCFFVNIAYILLGFQFIIQCLDLNLLSPWEWTLFFSLQIISVAQWLFMTYRCEAFYREVRKTKQLAITIMSIHFDGPLRNKAKQILNMVKERSPRFSVYAMWIIDVSLIFKLINLITLCMVNILQLVDIQKSTLVESYSFLNATNFLV